MAKLISKPELNLILSALVLGATATQSIAWADERSPASTPSESVPNSSVLLDLRANQLIQILFQIQGYWQPHH
jgi:hypothetical protein